MALTAEQIEAIREYVGDTPEDADLNVSYDSLGSLTKVVVRVLRKRLAVLGNGGPITWNLAGKYSESRSENAAILQRLLQDALKNGVGVDLDPDEPAAGSISVDHNPVYWPR